MATVARRRFGWRRGSLRTRSLLSLRSTSLAPSRRRSTAASSRASTHASATASRTGITAARLPLRPWSPSWPTSAS
eukprot:15266559-Alexandrium_andersonii.AAC.1